MESPETPFLETEALIAAMDEDHDEVHRLLVEMLPGERRTLAEAASQLAYACDMYNIEEGGSL